MAKLVFGMNQSLDGYVDHMAFARGPALFATSSRRLRGRQAGRLYGRQMYEVMRYWDDDHPEWNVDERTFAAVWRNQPKWVVSRSLKSVGPNASLLGIILWARSALKAEYSGDIEVAGPQLAKSVAEATVVAQFERIVEAARGCDTVVAASALQVAARSVAEKMGIGYVFVAYSPVVLPSLHHAPPPLPPSPGQPEPAANDNRER